MVREPRGGTLCIARTLREESQSGSCFGLRRKAKEEFMRHRGMLRDWKGGRMVL